MIAIEDDALHRAGGIEFFVGSMIAIAGEESAAEIAVGGAELADHIFPGEKHGDGDALVGGIIGVPAIDRYRVTGFFVIVGEDWGELFEDDVRGKFVVAIVEPGFRVKGVVIAGAYWVVPAPGLRALHRRDARW